MNWLRRLRNELNDRRLGIRQPITLTSSAVPLHLCDHGPAYRYTYPSGRKHLCRLCRATAYRQRHA